MTFEKPYALDSHHKIDQFDCGDETLNRYLKLFALTNQKNGSARVFVVLNAGNEVVGFYTLSAISVQFDDAPERLKHGMPREVPGILIGRFAVDQNYQGQGIGKSLLQDAFIKIATTSDNIGIRAAIVDAKTEKVKDFYIRQCGFSPFSAEAQRLYLLVKDIKKTLRKS